MHLTSVSGLGHHLYCHSNKRLFIIKTLSFSTKWPLLTMNIAIYFSFLQKGKAMLQLVPKSSRAISRVKVSTLTRLMAREDVSVEATHLT
jgi:hypothetical protein